MNWGMEANCFNESSFFFPSWSSKNLAFATMVHGFFRKAWESNNMLAYNLMDPERGNAIGQNWRKNKRQKITK